MFEKQEAVTMLGTGYACGVCDMKIKRKVPVTRVTKHPISSLCCVRDKKEKKSRYFSGLFLWLSLCKIGLIILVEWICFEEMMVAYHTSCLDCCVVLGLSLNCLLCSFHG